MKLNTSKKISFLQSNNSIRPVFIYSLYPLLNQWRFNGGKYVHVDCCLVDYCQLVLYTRLLYFQVFIDCFLQVFIEHHRKTTVINPEKVSL